MPEEQLNKWYEAKASPTLKAIFLGTIAVLLD